MTGVWFFKLAEAALAVAAACYLVHSGYSGDYFGEFLLSIFLQALFVGCVYMFVRKTQVNIPVTVIAAAVVSFLCPLAGYCAFRAKTAGSRRK